MNPPGTQPFPSEWFPWSKGVVRLSGSDTLRSDLVNGTWERPASVDFSQTAHQGQFNTGIAFYPTFRTSMREGRNGGSRFGVWVGPVFRWAGPVLFLAGGLLLTPSPGFADDWSRGSRGIFADGLPRYSQPLRPSTEDLLLKKSAEQVADALAAYAEGIAAEENADNERALEAYQKALGLDASNTELAVKVAFALVQRKQIPQGIDILKDAEKAAPKDLLPPLCLSQVYEKFLNKPELAERYAQKAHRLDPTNIGPYLALYEIYHTSGQAKKAEAILKKASEAPTKEPLFWLQLAEARIREAGEKTGRTFPPELAVQIVPLLEKALKGHENDLATVTRVADAYILIGHVKEATPLYRQAVEQNPSPKSDEALLIRNKLAQCLLAGETPEEGVETLKKMIQDAPTRLESYELLAEWHALKGETDRAIEVYRQALDVDSSQAKYHLRIAQVQLVAEKINDAISTLVATRRLFPQQASITYELAQTLLQAERYKEALQVFEQAFREGRYANDEILSAEFFFGYGMAAERNGNLDLAAQCLRRSIELDPDNAAQAYNYLGYMWADEGVHLPEALELIQLALRMEPDNAAYLDSLGWVYYRMGKYPLAVEYLRKASERMVPAEAVIYDHLGDALLRAGQSAEALECWKKALELEPDNEKILQKVATTPAAAPEAAPSQEAPAVLTSTSATPDAAPAQNAPPANTGKPVQK